MLGWMEVGAKTGSRPTYGLNQSSDHREVRHLRNSGFFSGKPGNLKKDGMIVENCRYLMRE
jgi:hypothetical protein